MKAASKGHKDIVQQLLDKGANIHTTDVRAVAPHLLWAIARQ